MAFDGPAPSASDLSRRWKSVLAAAGPVVDTLPPETSGTCVLADDGELFVGSAEAATHALAAGHLRFHEGRLRGALPQLAR